MPNTPSISHPRATPAAPPRASKVESRTSLESSPRASLGRTQLTSTSYWTCNWSSWCAPRSYAMCCRWSSREICKKSTNGWRFTVRGTTVWVALDETRSTASWRTCRMIPRHCLVRRPLRGRPSAPLRMHLRYLRRRCLHIVSLLSQIMCWIYLLL